jgi:hypothetical protein
MRHTWLALIIIISNLNSQEAKSISIDLKNGQDLEWWSKYNKNGLSYKNSSISLFYTKKFTKYDFTFSSYFSDDNLIIGESFIKFDLPFNSNIKLGKYYRDFSHYLNDSLSSGSMLISKNAMPLKKIGFLGEYSLKNNRVFKLSYGLSHSILGTNMFYSKSPNIHEKFLYLHKTDNKYEYGIGFVHEAMWGGSSNVKGVFPSSFNDFLKVFVSADGPLEDGQAHANALGNHLGIWDFYLIKNKKNGYLKFYYQHLFEDTSGLRFDNKSDGLWGFEYSNDSSNINLVIEYLNTSNQDSDPPYVDESYYNHFEYILGWSYKGYVLGNPFINNLNPNPLELIHFGLSSANSNKFNTKFLLSRRIDISENVKYSIGIGRSFEELDVDFILNGQYSKNISIKFSYNL